MRMGKRIDPENFKDKTLRKEKFWYHDTFGPMNLGAPKCAYKGCNRLSWMGKYCPDHKEKRDG